MENTDEELDEVFSPKFSYTAPAVGFMPPGYSTCCDRNMRKRAMFHVTNVLRLLFSWQTLTALALSEGCTVLCIKLDAYARIHPNLFLTVLVFPLAFSINAVYQRRERALDDLGALRSACLAWFFLHQEWSDKLADPCVLGRTIPDEDREKWTKHNQEYGKWHLEQTYLTLQTLLQHVKAYLMTPDTNYGESDNEHSSRKGRIRGRNKNLANIYRSLKEISASNERLRIASTAAATPHLKNPLFVQPPILTRPIHWAFFIIQAFEKLKGIREYRSPTSIRSFTKVLTWIVPMLLAPYFSWVANDYQEWAAYFSCFFVTVTINALRVVQDFGENPFLPIGEHDIDNLNLHDLDLEWGSVMERPPPPPPSDPLS